MNSVLTKANNLIMEKSTEERVPPYTVFRRGTFLHISFGSEGCRFKKQGSCTMCNYGKGIKLKKEDVSPILNAIFNELSCQIDELLIGSCGSIFDINEVSFDVLEEIIDYVVKLHLKTIIFETHYTTVTDQILDYIEDKFKNENTEIVIEMGLESSDPFVLENCLNKPIDLNAMTCVVQKIKNRNMAVVLNVLLGTPFLDYSQQINDCLKAIDYSLEIGANRVDIFPVNIKKHTLIEYLYENGLYERISLWQLVELLSLLPNESLSKVEFSWIGERQRNGAATDSLPPECCNVCEKPLFDFFENFLSTFSAERRKNLTQNVIDNAKKIGCVCNVSRYSPDGSNINNQTIQDKLSAVKRKLIP